MSDILKGKTILVTGGTGSFGQILVERLLAERSPAAVRIFSRDEGKQHEMANQLGPRPDVRFLIGDVRDRARVARALRGVDVVFHAAAMKHVSFSAYNPFEALATNCVGTQNIIEASIDEGVERLILTSSDKAVNPSSTMGATKLVAERLVSAAIHYKGNAPTIAATVRFGNVLGSRGSVVPLFAQQIAKGGPVTLTHRDMTRFVMTPEQTVDLIFQATARAEGGEIFVPKMPVLRIEDLARAMIEELAPRHGLDPAAIPVQMVGIKPGEKTYEELATAEECERLRDIGDLYVIPPQVEGIPGEDVKVPEFHPTVRPELLNSALVPPMTVPEIRRFLREARLVPTR